MKKIICLALCAILVFGLIVPVSAENASSLLTMAMNMYRSGDAGGALKICYSLKDENLTAYEKARKSEIINLCETNPITQTNGAYTKSDDSENLTKYISSTTKKINRAVEENDADAIPNLLQRIEYIEENGESDTASNLTKKLSEMPALDPANWHLMDFGVIRPFFVDNAATQYIENTKTQIQSAISASNGRKLVEELVSKIMLIHGAGYAEQALELCYLIRKIPSVDTSLLKDTNDIIAKHEEKINSEINNELDRALTLYKSGIISTALSICKTLEVKALSAEQTQKLYNVSSLCETAVQNKINEALTLYQQGNLKDSLYLCNTIKTWRINYDQNRSCDDIIKLITQKQAEQDTANLYAEINNALKLYQDGDITGALTMCENLKKKNLDADQMRACDDIIALVRQKQNEQDILKVYDDINKALGLYQSGNFVDAVTLCESIKLQNITDDQIRSCDDILALCYASVQEKLNNPAPAFPIDTTDYGSIFKQFIDSKGGKNWTCPPPNDGYYTARCHFKDAYLLDFEQDGVPELVAIFADNNNTDPYARAYIYKYKNGQINEWANSYGWGRYRSDFLDTYIVRRNGLYYLCIEDFERTWDWDNNWVTGKHRVFDPVDGTWKEYTKKYPWGEDGPVYFTDQSGQHLGIANDQNTIPDVPILKKIHDIIAYGTTEINIAKYSGWTFSKQLTDAEIGCNYGSALFKFYASDYASQTKALIDKAVAENNLSVKEPLLKRVKILENNGYGYLISSYADKLDQMSILRPAFLHLLDTDKLKEIFPSQANKYITDTKANIQTATSAGNGAKNIPMLIQKAFTVYRAGYTDDAVTLCDAIKKIPGINESQISETNAIIDACNSSKTLWIYDEINRALALYQKGDYDGALKLCNTIKSWDLTADQARGCDDIIKLANEGKQNSASLAIYDEINRALDMCNKGDFDGAINLCNSIKSRNINDDQKRSCDDVINLCYTKCQEQINYALSLYQKGKYMDAIRESENVKSMNISSAINRSCDDIILLSIPLAMEDIRNNKYNNRPLEAYNIYTKLYSTSPSLRNKLNTSYASLDSQISHLINGVLTQTIYAKSGITKTVNISEYSAYLNTGVWFGSRYLSESAMKNTAYNSVKNHIRSMLYVQGSGQFPDVSSVTFSKVNDTRYVMRGTYSALNRLGIRVQGSYTAYINYTPYGISSVEINDD